MMRSHGDEVKRGFAGRAAAILLLILLVSLPAAGQRLRTPSDFAYERLIASWPLLADVTHMAERHGATLGLYGGTIRDLYLGRPFTPISDIDIMYNSSDRDFTSFRDELMMYNRNLKGGLPKPDFHFDLADMENENARQHLYHNIGITATKVGVMRDNGLMDPTGHGIEDLRNRVFRYWPPRRDVIEPENIGRFVRDLVRLHTFRRDEPTIALMRRSLAACADPATDAGRRTIAAARHCRSMTKSGELLSFPMLINDSRSDLRFLHNDQPERLTRSYPFDMLYFDLFRTVTQADDMESMREVFATLGVPELLSRLGFASESAVLMDPALSREELFDRFAFPGHAPASALASESFEAVWERTLRRYNYRVLFDMLISDLREGSHERLWLSLRKEDFLKPSSYAMLNPGDDYREMILGYLDADFNIGVLPRASATRSLDWFVRTYLPLGNVTLRPVALPAPGTPAPAGIRPGYSPEILAIDRFAPHSLVNLEEYLEIQTGPELASLQLDPRCHWALLMGDAREAAAYLASRGCTKAFEVNACGFNRRRKTMMGVARDGERVYIAEYGFYTDDQLLNHEARVYFLRRGHGPAVDRNIETLRRPGADLPGADGIDRFLNELGEPVRVFFVGFSTPLKRHLVDQRLVRLGDIELRVGHLTLSERERPLVIALSGFGANYGTLPARLLAHLTGRGLRAVVAVGTGGGLHRGVTRRFGWVAPSRIFLAGARAGDDSAEIVVDNAAARLKLPGIVSYARHATVPTVLAETQQRISELRARRTLSVDCEQYHLASILRRHAPAVILYSLVNITDFPMGDESERASAGPGITLENSPDQAKAVEDALTRIVDDLRGRFQ
ncbi:MAG TPA: hypothetical protein VIV61_03500 [Candidatus Ozemobacteraceae bacterium]